MQRGGLVRLGAQPVLHGLLETFDLAAGGGVVRAGVLLPDAQASQLGLQLRAAAFPAGEPDGVDHAASVRVDAGYPCWLAVEVKVASTIGAVMQAWAEMCRA